MSENPHTPQSKEELTPREKTIFTAFLLIVVFGLIGFIAGLDIGTILVGIAMVVVVTISRVVRGGARE